MCAYITECVLLLQEARGKTIVVIFPSSGIRYIEHALWDTERHEAAMALPEVRVTHTYVMM